VSFGPVALELRHALEPWPVLGEAATSSGTSRAVDASLDRLQVRLSGMDAGRHVLLCNGRRVPLHSTGAAGEYVAGIRFRARMFHSVLHSTIGIQSPLTFDVADSDGNKLGGCSYHSLDPSGNAYADLPANEKEAAARRKSRFVTRGPTTGKLRLPSVTPESNAPFTLDLRYQPD